MRRSYLRIRRNRTHNGRPYARDRVREVDPDFPRDGEPRPVQGEGEGDRPVDTGERFPRHGSD